MRGKIKKLNTLDQLINEIPEDGRFTLLLEDWDEGFIVKPQNGKELKNLINELKNKFDSLFSFRFFSETLEINWNGEEGILAETSNGGDYEIEEQEIYLEGDYGRYPGLTVLKPYKMVKVQIFKKNLDKVLYIKLKSFEGGKDAR